MTPTAAELLEREVTLSIESVDRLYLNGYVPRLQTPAQLGFFLREHKGKPVASPVLLQQFSSRYVEDVKSFVARNDIPFIHFERGQRKDDVAAKQRGRYRSTEGVVFVGVAQEKAYSFKSSKATAKPSKAEARELVRFNFYRQSVSVNHFYFYVHDPEWGPAFVKVCSYLPYPLKICLNGHEWAKQQMRQQGIGFKSLDNGFLQTDDAKRLQETCARLGTHDILAFYERWMSRLPWPLDVDDRAAGYEHRLTIWQMEMSLTQVFRRPVQGRQFFEQVIRNNLDLGRPDRVRLLFPLHAIRTTPPPRFGYRTRVITDGVQPSLHVEFKRSHVKQYFKEERALRTETTINDPTDFYLRKGLPSFDRLRDIGQAVNHKLLEVERLADDCVLRVDEIEDLQRPTSHDAQRASALRFSDLRVMALFFALCLFVHIPNGFRIREIRPHVAGLLGDSLQHYSPGRATYDLRRLRLKGLIEKVPGKHTYHVTPLGRRVAYFHSRLYVRLLRPAWAAILSFNDGIPRPLHRAFQRVDLEIEKLRNSAGFKEAA